MTKEKNIMEIADSVSSEQDLIRFIGVLSNDLLQNNEEWQNVTLPDYLEGMGAFLESLNSRELSEGVKTLDLKSIDANAWRAFAIILLTSGVYE